MKKENPHIEELKEALKEATPSRQASLLTELWQSGCTDKALFESFKESKNSSLKATANRIIKSLATGVEERDDEKLKRLEKELKSPSLSKEKRFHLYREIALIPSSVSERNDLLLKGFEDTSWAIRDFLVETFTNEERLSNDLFLDLAKAPLWMNRREAIRILGKRKEARLLDLLDPIAQESNADIKIIFIEALENLEVKGILPAVGRFLKDENLWVKKRAEKAVKALKEKAQGAPGMSTEEKG